MAYAATRTLLALFVTFCASGRGLTAEKPLRPRNVKLTSVGKGLKVSWEPPVQLDGSPVDGYSIGYGKSMRSLRIIKVGKDSRSQLLEDVEPGVLHFLKMSAENEEGMSKPVYRAETPGGPEFVKLDGFAVVGGAPVNSSSAVSTRSRAAAPRAESPVQAVATVDRNKQPSGVSVARTHRRPPQSSSGPRQPERALAGTPLVDRRPQRYTKPQSDQRNRNSASQLASESVHVVSLQAQRALGRSAPANRAAITKKATPEPEEYEAKDISVRVMSPQSVLISWVDPAVEMGKVTAGTSRSYTVKYREKGESARWEYKESTQRRVLIDTLSADGMYEFSLRISQGDKHGKWTVSVFQRTPEAAPAGPPENFEVKPLRGKGTAVTATWDPPEEPNGRIREYIMSYAPAMKPFGMKSVTYRGSTTTATIDGLTPGDRYIFKIRATNRKGQGPQSKAFTVVMPASSAASSSSKNLDRRRTSHIPSKQDSHDEETDLQSTEVTEEPTTPTQTTQAPPTNRRTRPLTATQTRSYHSIFSSVRGSVRNGVNRGTSSRGREEEREEKDEQVEEKSPTTPPPVKDETDDEAVEEQKPPDNDVVQEPPTPENPSLKAVTPSPTKRAPKPPKPPRRPVKIRVHQKPGSSGSSSSSTSSSSSPSSSLPDSSRTQESAATRKDHTALNYPESKDAYAQPSVINTKPSTPAPKHATSQPQTDAPSVGRGSATGGRSSGSGFGSRFGSGRRHPGVLSRGNPTRVLNGYKPSTASSQASLPTRSQNQAASNSHQSTPLQSTLPSGSQNHESSNTYNSAASESASRTGSQSHATPNTYNRDASGSASRTGSESHATPNMYNPDASGSASRTGSEGHTTPNTYNPDASGSAPRTGSQSHSTSNTYNPDASGSASRTGSQSHATPNRYNPATSGSASRTGSEGHATPNTYNPDASGSASRTGSQSHSTSNTYNPDASGSASRTGSQSHATPNRYNPATSGSASRTGSEGHATPNTYNPDASGSASRTGSQSHSTSNTYNPDASGSASRTGSQSHATPNRYNPATSGSASRTGSQSHSTSNTYNPDASGSASRTGSQSHATPNTYNPDASGSASRTGSQSRATSNIHNPAASGSASRTGSQSHATSNMHNPAASGSASRTGSQSRTTSNTHNSRPHSPSTSHTRYPPTDSFTSQSGTQNPSASDAHNSGSSQSSSHRGSHNPATSRNTQHTSHAPTQQDTMYREGNDHSKHHTETEEVTEDGTSNARSTTSSNTHTQPAEEEKREEEGRRGDSSEKPLSSPSRTQPSIAQRFPSLATRYPGRFGSGSRVGRVDGRQDGGVEGRQDGRVPWSRASSSVGAGRPILRGTPTRVSGAAGAAGVPSIQETSDDGKTPSSFDPIKNAMGTGSLKPSSTNRNTMHGGSRQPTRSSSPSSSSNSNSHASSIGHRDSRDPIYTGTSNDNIDDNGNNDHDEDYLDEGSKEIYDKNDKVSDPTVAPKRTALTLNDPDRTLESNESEDTGEISPRTRTGSFSALPPFQRRPALGPNGRVRSPLLANRQLGGQRFPLKVQPAQNTRLGSSTSDSSASSSASSSSSSRGRGSDHRVGSGTSADPTDGSSGETSLSSSSSSSRDSTGGQGTRTRYPGQRGKPTNGGGLKPAYGNGKNGRPNLTTTHDKTQESSSSNDNSKANGRRFITGPDGKKWVVDLDRGVLMNEEGRILQDSEGNPRRVVLGEDGRTIFDNQGSPLVNQEGMALFGNGRDGRPVVNPKDKHLTVGGKPIVGLDRPNLRTTTTTTTTTEPTTIPATTEWSSEESTLEPFPTCPPGTYSKMDEDGYPVLDPDGILDCYPEEESSGMDMDSTVTVGMVPDALALDEDEVLVQTTLQPTTAITTTTTTTTTTTEVPSPEPDTRPHNKPSSEFDLAGRKRFTAPYLNYIQKDPGAPCSLNEALEYLQVDILENLLEKDNQNQPPKNKPHNITVVAMEGCHSFVILDWAIPLKDDMVSGYVVYSASYDDVINNRWSTGPSTGTHLAVENLKPNSRYYFKVQAKNVFGLGPVSDTLTYVTESDDPLLIERPPGGEPIWIPFTFKYNHAHSACKGSQYVKRTWYRKFVGVVLCNSLRYKIFMGDGLREPFYSIGDTFGQGEDHCQFVDSYLDGRSGPVYLSNNLPTAQGFHRSYRQEPVTFGTIGRRTPHPFVGWYECGVPIPGKW